MATVDAEMTRMVRSQIARRNVDASLLDIRALHGTIYLRGVLGVLRLHRDIDLEHEMAHISTVLRSKPGIRDVVWEVSLRK